MSKATRRDPSDAEVLARGLDYTIKVVAQEVAIARETVPEWLAFRGSWGEFVRERLNGSPAFVAALEREAEAINLEVPEPPEEMTLPMLGRALWTAWQRATAAHEAAEEAVEGWLWAPDGGGADPDFDGPEEVERLRALAHGKLFSEATLGQLALARRLAEALATDSGAG